ncbi:MAG: hypothetical protein U0Q16_33075 [Bryobacteraceae bacterium]
MDGRFCPACGAPQGGAAPQPGMGAPAAPQVNAGGLTENLAGALCYLLGFITGILFLVLAPYNQNPRVRFHAFQSIFANVAWIAFWVVVNIIGVFAHIFALLLIPVYLLAGLGAFCLWLYLMYRAYNNNPLVLPVVGPLAQQQAGQQ